MTQHDAQAGDEIQRIKQLLVRQASLGKQLAEITKEIGEVVQYHDTEITRMNGIVEANTNLLSALVHRILDLEKKVNR